MHGGFGIEEDRTSCDSGVSTAHTSCQSRQTPSNDSTRAKMKRVSSRIQNNAIEWFDRIGLTQNDVAFGNRLLKSLVRLMLCSSDMFERHHMLLLLFFIANVSVSNFVRLGQQSREFFFVWFLLFWRKATKLKCLSSWIYSTTNNNFWHVAFD